MSIQTTPFIPAIRLILLDQIHSGQLEISDKDLARLKHNDWFIQKFINFNNRIHLNTARDGEKIQQVVKKMKSVLSYRFEKKVAEMDPRVVPKELFMTPGLRQSVNSMNPSLKIFYVDITSFKKIDQMKEILTDVLCFMAERELSDYGSDGKDMVLMIEYTRIRMENIDITFSVAMAYLVLNSYVFMGSKIILYDPPWFFQPFIRLFASFLPAKYQSFLEMRTPHDAETNQSFRTEVFPDFLGGPVETKPIDTVQGSRPLHEVALLKGIKYKNYVKIRQFFESMLDDRVIERYNRENNVPPLESLILKRMLEWNSKHVVTMSAGE